MPSTQKSNGKCLPVPLIMLIETKLVANAAILAYGDRHINGWVPVRELFVKGARSYTQESGVLRFVSVCSSWLEEYSVSPTSYRIVHVHANPMSLDPPKSSRAKTFESLDQLSSGTA